jgi:hypothetical protein
MSECELNTASLCLGLTVVLDSVIVSALPDALLSQLGGKKGHHHRHRLAGITCFKEQVDDWIVIALGERVCAG